MLRKMIAGAVAAACVGLAAPVAQASHIPGLAFSAGPYTVNPTAVGEAQGPFSAVYLNFNYQAEVDQGVLTFTETGIAQFTAFSTALGSGVIGAGTSGLNLGPGTAGYGLYGTFTAAGSDSNNATGGVDGTFASFNLQIFVDRNNDTTFNNLTAANVGAPNDTKTVTGGSADDALVLTGTLVPGQGGFHVNTGLVNGDFDVRFTVSTCGTVTGFFCGAGGLIAGSTLGDLNGVNTEIFGATGGAGVPQTDIIINGSGNMAFQRVPEPGSLALLGLAASIFGIGFGRRKSA